MKWKWLHSTFTFAFVLLYCASSACSENSVVPATFELCTINADSSFARPALLSGVDLSNVKAVSKSAWYVLSGRHTQSKIILTVKPERVSNWLLATRVAFQEGRRAAIVIDGKSIGTLIWMKPPEGDTLELDAAFFSSGNEDEKSEATKALARQINGSMK